MIIIIPTIKYSSTYYNTFTMGVCSNYHGYFFQCDVLYLFAFSVAAIRIIFRKKSCRFSMEWLISSLLFANTEHRERGNSGKQACEE